MNAHKTVIHWPPPTRAPHHMRLNTMICAARWAATKICERQEAVCSLPQYMRVWLICDCSLGVVHSFSGSVLHAKSVNHLKKWPAHILVPDLLLECYQNVRKNNENYHHLCWFRSHSKNFYLWDDLATPWKPWSSWGTKWMRRLFRKSLQTQSVAARRLQTKVKITRTFQTHLSTHHQLLRAKFWSWIFLDYALLYIRCNFIIATKIAHQPGAHQAPHTQVVIRKLTLTFPHRLVDRWPSASSSRSTDRHI